MASTQGKRQFGNIRKLPSGRYQARYTGPDGHMYPACRDNGGALTFQTRVVARSAPRVGPRPHCDRQRGR
jgi:hypothetical protein